MYELEAFDQEEYLQEQLREIEEVEERRFAKTLLLEEMGKSFAAMEEKYRQLEQRIGEEGKKAGGRYEIAMTIGEEESELPDPQVFFPVCAEEEQHSKEQPGLRGRAFTIYLEAKDQDCLEFFQSGQVSGRYPSSAERLNFRIHRCRRYEEAVEELKRRFASNQIPWEPLHCGHLERFFDLVEEAAEGKEGGEKRKESEKSETREDEEAVIDWGRWGPYVRRKRQLFWNAQIQYTEPNRFRMPGSKAKEYDYVIHPEKPGKQEYLVEIGGDILGAVYGQDRVVVRTAKEMVQIKVYVIHQEEEEQTKRCPYPVFSNRKKDSFCGRYLQKSGIFLQTRAELDRKIEALSGKYQIAATRYEIKDKVPPGALLGERSPLGKEEVFPEEKRRVFVLYFQEQEEQDCYYYAQIRYLLSCLQREYLEYSWAGVMEGTKGKEEKEWNE